MPSITGSGTVVVLYVTGVTGVTGTAVDKAVSVSQTQPRIWSTEFNKICSLNNI
jgi:hypothetical protein